MTNKSLTQKYLKEILHYNPDTGVFIWKISIRNKTVMIGDIAGFKHTSRGKTYVIIKINQIKHYAHRLAWIYVHGVLPCNQIDHENQDSTDNRIENLHDATCSDNQKNRKLNKNNTSGTVGVVWSGSMNKWIAQITTNGERVYLGAFKEINHAIMARWLAEDKYGFHPNHGR